MITTKTQKKEFPFYILYDIRGERSNSLYVCMGVYKPVALRGEGRRDWVVWSRYGLRMNQVITLESIEFSFYDIYHTFNKNYFYIEILLLQKIWHLDAPI